MVGGNFSLFVPLSKVDRERRQVAGYASTPALDLDGEVVSLDAVRKALPGYMQWRNIRRMHTPDAVGVAKEASMDDKGLFLTAKIVDEDAWTKCVEEVYKGFSIGGRKLAKNGNVITEIELVEISLVDRPANPDCKFSVQKSASPEAPAFLLPVKSEGKGRKLKLLAKAASVASGITEFLTKDGPPAARDGFSLAAKPGTACEAHGKVDCPECADVAKREFNTKQRESAASSGAALPDGSFPIENASDLRNAIQAIGRAKDPGKARAHIKSRAKAMGHSELIPDSWKGAKALAKSARRVAAAEAYALHLETESAAMPSPLTFVADSGVRATGQVESGHELDLGRSDAFAGDGTSGALRFSKRERKMLKRMNVAASLSYCFDSLRNAQRALLAEAQAEGGDRKDAALAQKLGTLSQGLAAVIGQKAEHEGQEALDLTDADDRYLESILVEGTKMARNDQRYDLDTILAAAGLQKAGPRVTGNQRVAIARDRLKKAKKSATNMEECIKSAYAMHKAAYLAKAARGGKKPDDDGDFDHQGAMEKLQKAAGETQALKTFIKAAGVQLKKAASGRVGQQGQQVDDGVSGVYEVPDGITVLSNTDIATAGPGSPGQSGSPPPVNSLDARFPGKGARGGLVTAAHSEALQRAAAAEAVVEVLKSMPAGGGKRPVAFDVSRLGLDAKDTDRGAALLKGVNVEALDSMDENQRNVAVGNVIGNMITGGHGRSVFDPAFHGNAGGGSR